MSEKIGGAKGSRLEEDFVELERVSSHDFLVSLYLSLETRRAEVFMLLCTATHACLGITRKIMPLFVVEHRFLSIFFL